MKEKKTVKINFVGFWDGFNKENNLFTRILQERYNVEISNTPDYIFCSPLDTPFAYTEYNCVRIFFSGEPFAPNFADFDYAITFDYIDFGDRYFRFPLYLYDMIYKPKYLGENTYFTREQLNYDQAKQILNNKKYFCNFIYGNHSPAGIREKLFEELSKYKRVESFGTYLNNQPDNKTVSQNATKFKVVQDSKFTIVGESMSYPGFTSEKIGHAITNYSIPIYFGDPLIEKQFNKDAIISYFDFNSIDDLVEYVKKVDTNDELYIKMLMTYPTIDTDQVETFYLGLKNFLFNIFDQQPEKAFRRVKKYIAKRFNDYEHQYYKFRKFGRKIKSIFKK